jgi:hypothetical protein
MQRILLKRGNIMPDTDSSPWAQNDNPNVRASVIPSGTKRESLPPPFLLLTFYFLRFTSSEDGCPMTHVGHDGGEEMLTENWEWELGNSVIVTNLRFPGKIAS